MKIDFNRILLRNVASTALSFGEYRARALIARNRGHIDDARYWARCSRDYFASLTQLLKLGEEELA